MARAKETILTLVLLSLIILGMMYVVAALIDRDRDSIDRIFRKLTLVKTKEPFFLSTLAKHASLSLNIEKKNCHLSRIRCPIAETNT